MIVVFGGFVFCDFRLWKRCGGDFCLCGCCSVRYRLVFWYWFRCLQTLVTVGAGVLLFYVLVGYLSWLTCYGV